MESVALRRAPPLPGLIQLGLIGLLLALAAVAWTATGDRMGGMDAGPGTDPGAVGFFVGTWVVMMAAMMFPSVSPTVALYARMTRSRTALAPWLFTAAYLLTWSTAGVLAYGVSQAGRGLLGPELAWDRAGRFVAGGTLLFAAAYELTPLKDVCLAKCRSPLGFLLGAWRDGLRGALAMGARHGAWCVGCCWALMVVLVMAGMMSLLWVLAVFVIVTVEKLAPRGLVVARLTGAGLLALAVWEGMGWSSMPGM